MLKPSSPLSRAASRNILDRDGQVPNAGASPLPVGLQPTAGRSSPRGGEEGDPFLMARAGAASSACAPSFPDPGCTCRRSNERISGRVDEAILECKTEWVAAHPEKVRLRKYLVEDPSGPI